MEANLESVINTGVTSSHSFRQAAIQWKIKTMCLVGIVKLCIVPTLTIHLRSCADLGKPSSKEEGSDNL